LLELSTDSATDAAGSPTRAQVKPVPLSELDCGQPAGLATVAAAHLAKRSPIAFLIATEATAVEVRLSVIGVETPDAIAVWVSASKRLEAEVTILWVPGKTAAVTVLPIAATGEPSTVTFVSAEGRAKLSVEGTITMRQSGKRK
jgi:hypothetical protein